MSVRDPLAVVRSKGQDQKVASEDPFLSVPPASMPPQWTWSQKLQVREKYSSDIIIADRTLAEYMRLTLRNYSWKEKIPVAWPIVAPEAVSFFLMTSKQGSLGPTISAWHNEE